MADTDQGLLQILSLVTPDQIDRRIPGHDRAIQERVAMAVAHDRAHAAQLRQMLVQKEG